MNMITCVLALTATFPLTTTSWSTYRSNIGNGCILRIAGSSARSGYRFIATAMSPTLIAGDTRNGCMINE